MKHCCNQGVEVNGHRWNYPYVNTECCKAAKPKRLIIVVRTAQVTAVYYPLNNNFAVQLRV